MTLATGRPVLAIQPEQLTAKWAREDLNLHGVAPTGS